MNTKLEAKLKTLPRSSGVYFHKSANGEIIYVGKAAILKNRVKQYFQSSKDFDIKTRALVNEIEDTDWVETESEIDALFLESEMVKRYKPRYNILLRDDKSQTFIRIDMKNERPCVTYTRNPADDGADYYGPYYNGVPVKKALRYLRRVFPYYTREPGVTEKADLDAHLGLSPYGLSNVEYKAALRKLISYIKGNRKQITAEIERDMKTAAGLHDFERAAVLRNQLRNLKELQRRIMFGDSEFLDISKDKALSDLMHLLNLTKVPRRIEGFDISHMGGTNVVASQVVFINGVSSRADYRKYKTRQERNDDTGNMHEVICRRLSEKNIKAWGLPDLLLVDGGKGQLEAAIGAAEFRAQAVPVLSIAKREEELITHKTRSNIATDTLHQLMIRPESGVRVVEEGEYFIVNLHFGQVNASSHSKNLRGDVTAPGATYTDVVKLIQRIRDESHRFAVSYHTVLKRQKQTASTLEDIPGIGPATRKKLIKQFGSLRGVKQADASDLAAVIGDAKAATLAKYLLTE